MDGDEELVSHLHTGGGLTRAQLLARGVVGTGALTAGGILAGGLPKLAVSKPSREQDARVLEWLLQVEYLQAAFYTEAERRGRLRGELREFAVRDISLTRIESRPRRERLGVYSFSLDCEGHVLDRRVGEALAALHRVCDDVRFLGSYPRADDRQNRPVAATADDAAFAEAEVWLGRVREGTA